MILTQDIQQALAKMVRGRLNFNEPMRDHSSIKIGGRADVWVEPMDMEDLVNVIRFADENGIHRMVFGNGSNTLVRDGGIRGIVISLSHFISIEQLSPTEVRAGAGVGLQPLLLWSIENSLSGFECLAGIPGTVGGAIIMNAGIKERTIGDSVKNIKYVSRNRVVTVEKEDLEFSYRKLKLPKGAIVVEAGFVLNPGDKAAMESDIAKRRKQRGEVQPLLWPSLGSVFKNPDKAKAWQLIDDCGLRGVRVGGARVANEHANWIVNEGGATAKDVEVLIKVIKEKVRDKTDVTLEPEIMIVGEAGE